MSEAKTVAIIGAGPVGLAAAAHVLERGMSPDRAGGRRSARTRCANGATCSCSRRGNTTSTAPRRACWRRRDGIRPTRAPIRPAASCSSATSSRSRPKRALARRIHTSSRVTAISRVGFDKAKTKGREAAPSKSATRTARARSAARGRRDRCIRHLVFAQSRRRQRPARDRRERSAGRIAYGMPDVLGKDRAPLCRQDRRGARRRPLRDRHADRSRAARERKRRGPSDLAAARQRSRQGFWRRRQRQARRPRRTRPAFAALVAAGQIRVEPSSRVTHLATDGRLGSRAGSGCCGRHVIVDELIVATGFRPDLRSCANFACGSIPRSRRRWRWRR